MKTPVVALGNEQNLYQLKILVSFNEKQIGDIVSFHTIIKIIILEMKDLKK